MGRELKLGLNTGYWAGGPPPGASEAIAEAERLGFDSIWTAEAYGSDCLTPLAWWGASTSRLKLGTAIVQMSARQPAATAMAAMTMDHLSGGGVILGLGVSRSGASEAIAEAERLGFDSIWTAEAYGSDCLTPLAWWGASTSRLKLGTAIVQMSARQPAATAMAAMTMDHLSGGRFILGLGVSGPQVVEGWYGMSFAKPLARTREYIGILRDVWARRGPVVSEGEHYPLPRPDGTGLGKPLKSSIHPLREDIPIYLGAEGPN